MTLSPHQAAVDVLDRANGLLLAANSTTDPLAKDDIRRFALCQGVAALDTYLHRAVADVPLEKLPTKLKNLSIPFDDLVTLSEAVVANRGKAIRPKVRARNVLERETLKITFQSSRKVEEAMQMLGVAKAFSKISDTINPTQTAQDIKNRLDRIVNRRNKIVHEGDLQRQSRPRHIKRERVEPISIADDLAWLRSLVDAVDTVLK
jgi:hypothetical protein